MRPHEFKKTIFAQIFNLYQMLQYPINMRIVHFDFVVTNVESSLMIQ